MKNKTSPSSNLLASDYNSLNDPTMFGNDSIFEDKFEEGKKEINILDW